LGLEGANILRKLLGGMIVAEKCRALTQLISAATDEQYLKDAREFAAKAEFYEKVLTLLGEIQSGHKHDHPTQVFEYLALQKITAEKPTQPTT
jgi:predicted O-methyltransferase YrrM